MYLTPVKFIEKRKLGKKLYPFWLYICKCGKEKIINKYSVDKKQTKSCGCLKKDVAFKLPKGEASFNVIFYTYKQNAKNRNLEFSLEKEQFRKLITSNCKYCNSYPSTIFDRKPTKTLSKFNGSFTYNGIDRVNNNIGYITDNVVTCCEKCNYSKLDRTEEEFLNWIIKVYNHLVKNNVRF